MRLPLRPELVDQAPYGAPQLPAAIQLNVNENPYAPGPAVRAEMAAALLQAAGELNRYPDREANKLRAALANYLDGGLDTSNIWVANGSNEVMTHLLQAFGGPGRTMLTFDPTYSMYPEYARNTHTNYVTVPRGERFQVDVAAALAAIEMHQPHIVTLTTPNNPTGTITSLDVIDTICRSAPGIVVVDEAYIEFAAAPSAITLLDRHPNLAVSRTLSKAFALAGGRVGYLAASSEVVDACRIVRLPYHLSAQTQAVAEVALAHAPEMLAKVAQLRDECQSLQLWLRASGFDVFDSQANFCLFGTFADRHSTWEYLLGKGVLVRETGPAGFLRVSAGTPEQMRVFRDALTDWRSECG